MAISHLKFNENNSVIEINNEHFRVYAHKNEYFNEHISKTLKVFNTIKSEKILINFYELFIAEKYINLSYDQFNFLIEECVRFHDVGKLSFNFQIKRLNKNNISKKNEQLAVLKKFGLDSHLNQFEGNHSLSGALSFLSKYSDILQNNELFLLILAYIIIGHHSNIKDVKSQDDYFYTEFYEKKSLRTTLTYFSLFLDLNRSNVNQKFFQDVIDGGFDFLENTINKYDSSFSFFYSYIYSLLISADALASSEYDNSVNQIDYSKFNHRISEDLCSKMHDSFYDISYNKDLLNERFNLDNLETDDINVLRREMLLESSENLKNNLTYDKKVFFLNIPTGGGKTNTSMKLALDLIKNTDANRIIYAMPFINIIEQNFDVICKSYGLNEEDGNIRKIYSASENIFDDRNSEEILEILLADDFFNYPVICTTFVSLFNPVIKNNKKYKYRLNALANSVIVLDEIQSLPLKNWNSLYFIINELSNKYNIYFLIMSATLPSFDKLNLVNYRDNDVTLNYGSVALIENPKKYFNHYLFSRTIIDGNIKNLGMNDDDMLDYFLEVINENFNQNFNKGLIVLNTVKSSRIIYDKLKGFSQEYDFDIDLLNSTILPYKRKNIISKINNMGDLSNYILISTQSIEAGVDVSFDFVIRDFSILDSIEQVRGRCNRSRELNFRFDDPNKKGNVYLINLKDDNNSLYKYIYKDEELKTRIKETHNIFKSIYESNNDLHYDYDDILNYYDDVSSDINDLNDIMDQSFYRNDRKNIVFWNKMRYSKIQKKKGIHIINNDLNQYSLFVPANIKICDESLEFDETIEDMDSRELTDIYNKFKDQFIFSLSEILFLKETGDFLIEGNYVLGQEVLSHFQAMIATAQSDYNQKLIVQKTFSSILNNFIVNISLNNPDLEDKIKELKKEGYFYILEKNMIGESEENLYSKEYGFNSASSITEIL